MKKKYSLKVFPNLSPNIDIDESQCIEAHIISPSTPFMLK